MIDSCRSQTGFKTQMDMKETFEVIIKQSAVKSAFPKPDPHSTTTTATQPVFLWLGNTTREHYSPNYLRARQELADAAYFAKWDKVFELIDGSEQIYGENWSNSTRLSKAEGPH